jgi:hypothetical protein
MERAFILPADVTTVTAKQLLTTLSWNIGWKKTPNFT